MTHLPLDPDTLRRLKAAATHFVYDAVIITTPELDPPGPRVIYVNPAFTRMSGYRYDEIVGRTPRILQGPRTDRKVLDRLRRCLSRGQRFTGETYNYRKDGSEYLVEWRIDGIRGDRGDITHWVAVQRDVTEERRLRLELQAANKRLSLLAELDGLTGLANRRAFDTALDKEFRRARRSGLPLSLLLIDVDGFKQYNDLFGHLPGDRCLAAVAQAIAAQVHRPGDVVARFGGEEFAVLLPETDQQGAARLGEKLRCAVEQLGIPHVATGSSVVTISVGVAQRLPEEADPAPLVRRADRALYAAKRQGRNRVAVDTQPTA